MRTLDEAKTGYYSKLISDHSHDQSQLFKVMNKVMHREKTNPMPEHDNPKELADRF